MKRETAKNTVRRIITQNTKLFDQSYQLWPKRILNKYFSQNAGGYGHNAKNGAVFEQAVIQSITAAYPNIKVEHKFQIREDAHPYKRNRCEVDFLIPYNDIRGAIAIFCKISFRERSAQAFRVMDYMHQTWKTTPRLGGHGKSKHPPYAFLITRAEDQYKFDENSAIDHCEVELKSSNWNGYDQSKVLTILDHGSMKSLFDFIGKGLKK
jgi:hypothetical protein